MKYRPFVSFEGDPQTEEERVELYNYLRTVGLSDSEARGTAWHDGVVFVSTPPIYRDSIECEWVI